MSRYARQTQIAKLGQAGQIQLKEASVLLVGAGGLGCTVASQLVTAGIGRLTLLDHDQVDLSNLHRQWLFGESDVGKDKVHCAAQRLRAMNSECTIEAISERLSPANVNRLCEAATLVIDAADNFVVSYLLSDACWQSNKALVTGSVNQTFGYVAAVCGGAPSLRALFPKPAQQLANCDVVGVVGPSVGVIASLQALEALKLICGSADNLLGQIAYVETWPLNLNIIDMREAKEPAQRHFQLIGNDTLSSGNYFVVDVREAKEITTAPQAFDVDAKVSLTSIKSGKHSLSKDVRLALACRSGQRALIGAQALINQGFDDVAVIAPS